MSARHWITLAAMASATVLAVYWLAHGATTDGLLMLLVVQGMGRT